MAGKPKKRSTSRRRTRGNKSECIIPPPVPLEVLPEFTLNTPAHTERRIREYVEWQAKDEKVKHAERVTTETIFGRRHEVWDVHTDKMRWWVITEPTNLYSQALFPSMDYTLSFHVGLMARVEEAERGAGRSRTKLAAAWGRGRKRQTRLVRRTNPRTSKRSGCAAARACSNLCAP